MRVLISDYEEQMFEDYTMTLDAIRSVCPDADLIIEPYATQKFYQELALAEGLVTAFLPIDQAFLEKAPKLRCISQNSVGFSNIDMEAARKHKVAVCHIVEYCTREVAEHGISLMLALNHHLSEYAYEIAEKKVWSFQEVPTCQTVNHKVLAVFGLGRIGRETARLANALGVRVLGVDPYVDQEAMASIQVEKREPKEALQQADLIINHMAMTKDNYHFFDSEAFQLMKKDAMFINVGRGGCVDEEALLESLEQKQIAGAALDVLEDENPDMAACPFVSCKNVILTPHCAFHSVQSMEKLHQISGHNVACYLAGELEQVEGLEN